MLSVANRDSPEEPESKKFEPPGDLDLVILSAEENELAELLGELTHADFARILFRLSPDAKDEIRSAIGTLQAKASYRPHEE